ncbi:MAG: 3-isopropylmalate dehydratase small subunit [Alphaproteobacteria bacterium]|nr:3-isopropylmalate dehydratase small subunit [Alphaproteobacteria bacterium]
MQPFTKLKAIGIPIDRVNVDTDQIIPARFLPRPRTDPEYATFLFHDLRYDDDGNERPDFILNQEPYRKGRIIVADLNWGCGSSRESAVWTLLKNDIRCVIAPSFGDIHYNNGMNNGMLPVRLSREDCATLRRQLHDSPGAEIDVDLELQTVTGPDGATYKFEIDGFQKYRLLKGLDDIGVTHEYDKEFHAFEERYMKEASWLFNEVGQ